MRICTFYDFSFMQSSKQLFWKYDKLQKSISKVNTFVEWTCEKGDGVGVGGHAILNASLASERTVEAAFV